MKKLLLIVLMGAAITACDTHKDEHCVRTGSYYQAPTYIKSGSIMVPVGGGMVEYCAEYAPN